jgi:putative membrane protein
MTTPSSTTQNRLFTAPSSTLGKLAAVAASCAMAIAAVPAAAQSGNMPAATSSSDAAGKSTVVRGDRSLMNDLANGNHAEINMGKLALEKSQNPEVKKFAQQMVDDHTKALGELQELAQSKNVKLPDGAGPVNTTKATAMKALSGETFDNQYMKRGGVGAHESTLKLLQKVEANAKDADLKALAGKMKPTVQEHLKMAQASTPVKTSAK